MIVSKLPRLIWLTVGKKKSILTKTNLKNHLMGSNSNMSNYVDFVKQTTSEPSLDYGAMASRLAELEVTGTNTTQLLTAALGLTAESGEFTEVVKKIVFQGKPYNEDNVFHMKRELEDICWYLAQAFMALDTNFDEILDMNIEKLSARYPEGTFNSYYSENRKEGDL